MRVIPAWQALDVMTDAVIDQRWKDQVPSYGYTAEQLAQAKEGDFDATRDDMVEALGAIAKLVGFEVDWDAEPPEPSVLCASDVLHDGSIGPKEDQ